MDIPINSVGGVVAMWRYPVKSMQGEELDAAVFTDRGIVGDRAYALLDRATGQIASAKHPGRWGGLVGCRAAFAEPPQPGAPLPPVTITLPDGTIVSSAQTGADAILSRWLGREVALVAGAPEAARFAAYTTDAAGNPTAEQIVDAPLAPAAPGGALFNYAAVHLLTTATLDRLQALAPASSFDLRRFRPNIVVAPHDAGDDFAENAWIGQALAIGASARLDVIDPCPRCVVTTLPFADLPHDPAVLRTIARHTRAQSATAAPGLELSAVVGIYARVVVDGLVRRGDDVHLEPVVRFLA